MAARRDERSAPGGGHPIRPRGPLLNPPHCGPRQAAAMNDQLLAAVTQYGPAALFGIVTIAAIGVPLPITLLLIVVGSMVSQGAMNLWWALGVASGGSILGDQAGYAIGRWGGTAAVTRL